MRGGAGDERGGLKDEEGDDSQDVSRGEGRGQHVQEFSGKSWGGIPVFLANACWTLATVRGGEYLHFLVWLCFK